jgi:hypothetical protein
MQWLEIAQQHKLGPFIAAESHQATIFLDCPDNCD